MHVDLKAAGARGAGHILESLVVGTPAALTPEGHAPRSDCSSEIMRTPDSSVAC